jgi:uncharacterized protein (TIGR00251 family)
VTWWTADDDGLVLQVRATPGAKRSEVVGPADGRLRVRVAAPAVDGKANAELIRTIAAWCGVRRSAVRIERGDRARAKTVRVDGLAQPPDLSGRTAG